MKKLFRFGCQGAAIILGITISLLSTRSVSGAVFEPVEITINFGAAVLLDANGNPMPTGGLVIIAASTLDEAFLSPIPSAFLRSDDIEIARIALTHDGQFNLAATGLQLSGNWDAGDPLRLYWYPTLSLSAESPGEGTPYGSFRTDAILDQDGCTIAWVTPPGGSTDSLNFLTESAHGSNLDSTALASLTVTTAVPEPTATMAILSVTCIISLLLTRRKRVTNHG